MTPSPNLRKSLIEAGWQAIDTRNSPRAYTDASGKRFGTVERNGVRVALSIGEKLLDERGDVMVYMTDEPVDAILRALIVDEDARGQGLASKALKDIILLADVIGTTLFLEPAPIEDKPMDVTSLVNMYSRFEFEFAGSSRRVMVRRHHRKEKIVISQITRHGRKWVAETDARGALQRSTPLSSKKLAQEWLDGKAIDAIHGDASERLFSAAIVKGLIEHDDGTRFFGSTAEYTYHQAVAEKRGLITEADVVTASGREWYGRCLKQLPQTRQVFWTGGVGVPSNGVADPAALNGNCDAHFPC